MPGTELDLLIAVGAGLLSFLSPCVLPLFPSYLSFIAGSSLEELEAGTGAAGGRRVLLANALLFILGFSLVFVALGAGATLLGQLLFRSQILLRRAGGVLVILMGLHVAGWLRIPFLMRERRAHLAGRPAGYLGAVLVGMTFAAGWTPCIGPILGSILTLASVSQTAGAGILLLLAYSLGLAIPFLASALALRQFLVFFDGFRRFLPLVSTASGILLILLGLLLVSDYFTLLSRLAFSLTPEWLFRLEQSLLGTR